VVQTGEQEALDLGVALDVGVLGRLGRDGICSERIGHGSAWNVTSRPLKNLVRIMRQDDL
jgi:hypothetical protein